MNSNQISYSHLKNECLFNSKAEAISGLTKQGINDGVIKLARYFEDGKVKTIFGISYTYPSTNVTTYTIYDSFQEAMEELWRAINEMKGDVSEDYNSLEKIENIIKENADAAKVTISSETPSESASTISTTHKFYQGGIEIGQIDVYKDSFLKNVEIIYDEEGKAKWLRFTFICEDGSEKVVDVPLESFIQDIEAGDGLVVDSDGNINVVKDANSEDFLQIYPDSIAVIGVNDAINSAVTIAYDELIEYVNEAISSISGSTDAKLEQEIARAISAETELATAIQLETTRAVSVETELAQAIETEENRAISAETNLLTAIQLETTRAVSVETELRDQIADIEVIGTYAIDVAKNESGRKSTVSLKLAPKDEEVSENILSIEQDGLKFNTKLDCGIF